MQSFSSLSVSSQSCRRSNAATAASTGCFTSVAGASISSSSRRPSRGSSSTRSQLPGLLLHRFLLPPSSPLAAPSSTSPWRPPANSSAHCSGFFPPSKLLQSGQNLRWNPLRSPLALFLFAWRAAALHLRITSCTTAARSAS
jgi:hypothetical protein